MLNDESNKQAGIARLTSDLRSAKVELLSAQRRPASPSIHHRRYRFLWRAPGAKGRDRLCRRPMPFLCFHRGADEAL